MITIHDKYENDFSKNGFGDISQNVLSPEVSWKMNGEFKVSFSYPIFAKHSQHLLNENIVRVPVPYMDDQLFRIYKPNKELGYVEVEARHIFYDLLTNFIEDTNIVGQHGDSAIKQLLDRTVLPHKFYGSSDITSTNNMRIVRYNPVEALLDDGKANTFISRWGGQLYRDNFNIRMDRRIGSDRGVTIQYRKDLLGFDASIDHSSKVNRLMPIGFDGLILPEKYIDSPDIDMNDIRIGVVRYQDVKAAVGEYEEDEDAIPLEDAYDLLRSNANKEFTENRIDQPISSFEVDFVTLENTKEYEEFSQLQEIRQGDTVGVSVPDEGIEIQSIMVEFKSDPLRDNHYNSVVLGNFVDSLSSSVPKIDIVRQELDEHNKLITSSMLAANRKNRLFFGAQNPNDLQFTGLTLGDTYFQEDGDWFAIWEYVEVNGERYWRKGPNTDFGKELEAGIAETKGQAEEVRDNLIPVIDQLNEALQAGGETNLADLFARKIAEEDFGTLFFQSAKDIGLTYEEDGVTRAIIAISDGVPYIAGENIILDGNTTVDGTFTVTEQMIAPEAIIGHLVAEGINADEITVTNLNMENISGAAIELSRGFKITRNGNPVLDIDAVTGEVVMNVDSLLINEFSPVDDTVHTSDLQSYLRFDGGIVEIGERGADVKTQFGNDEWAMVHNNQKLMWLEQDVINIQKAHFFERMQVGNFGFVPRSNGSLDLRKVVD